MGFKDFENRVKNVKEKLNSDHQKAVEQSITPTADVSDNTALDSK